MLSLLPTLHFQVRLHFLQHLDGVLRFSANTTLATLRALASSQDTSEQELLPVSQELELWEEAIHASTQALASRSSISAGLLGDTFTDSLNSLGLQQVARPARMVADVQGRVRELLEDVDTRFQLLLSSIASQALEHHFSVTRTALESVLGPSQLLALVVDRAHAGLVARLEEGRKEVQGGLLLATGAVTQGGGEGRVG